MGVGTEEKIRDNNGMLDLFGFRIDLWTLWGFIAQSLFFGSFVVQWWKSEKVKKSYIPIEFWVLRLVASLMLVVYVFVRKDLVFMVSLILQMAIYVRNIYLIKNEK